MILKFFFFVSLNIQKSSIFGIVAFLAVSGHALPQGYTEERPEVELVYSRTGVSLFKGRKEEIEREIEKEREREIKINEKGDWGE